MRLCWACSTPYGRRSSTPGRFGAEGTQRGSQPENGVEVATFAVGAGVAKCLVISLIFREIRNKIFLWQYPAVTARTRRRGDAILRRGEVVQAFSGSYRSETPTLENHAV